MKAVIEQHTINYGRTNLNNNFRQNNLNQVEIIAPDKISNPNYVTKY